MGCTDKEACLFANIAPSSLYNYQQENAEFLERKELLKESPVLKARQTVFNALDKVTTATWWLERRTKDFKPRSDITSDDKPILSSLKEFSDGELERLAAGSAGGAS